MSHDVMGKLDHRDQATDLLPLILAIIIKLLASPLMPKKKSSKPSKRRISTDSEPDPSDYEDTTKHSKMDRPVTRCCAPSMAKSWKICGGLPSHVLFDAVNPARIFKKGTVFNEDDPDPFPTFDYRNNRSVTDTDPDGTLQQYKPLPNE